jgi:hypothetical protein
MTDKVLFSATPTQYPTDLHRLSQVEKAAPYFYLRLRKRSPST